MLLIIIYFIDKIIFRMKQIINHKGDPRAAISIHINNLQEELDTLWTIVCTFMIIMSQAGYMMKETGTIKM